MKVATAQMNTYCESITRKRTYVMSHFCYSFENGSINLLKFLFLII